MTGGGPVRQRFVFHPRERRGVLFGLQGGQVAVLLFGGVAALIAGRSVTGPPGPVAAVTVLVGSAVAALYPRGGRPLANWIPVAAGWGLRRAAGPRLDSSPLAGRVTVGRQLTGADPPAALPRRSMPVAPGPAGVELLEAPAQPGQDPLGVLRDSRTGCWAAAVPVRGASFALLDPDEQLRRLEGWRAVLGTLARAGTSVRRLQWVQRSWAASAGRPMSAPASAGGAAETSYLELLAGDGGTAQVHDTWLVVAVGGSGRPGRAAALEVLRREVRLLEGQLRHADLQVGRPLDRATLANLLAAAHHPGPGRSTPWAMASDESWSAVRVDDTWHATYWIAEWPRVDVGPDFLTPLLLAADRRTLSLVMAPVAPDRAVRQVRAARTADVADEELRSRAGFLPSAQRGREAEGVAQREVELADGHAEYRFSGYLTVSATDRAALTAACAQAEQAAQESHLELRRLFGRQSEAYTWTLPLGRGLA